MHECTAYTRMPAVQARPVPGAQGWLFGLIGIDIPFFPIHNKLPMDDEPGLPTGDKFFDAWLGACMIGFSRETDHASALYTSGPQKQGRQETIIGIQDFSDLQGVSIHALVHLYGMKATRPGMEEYTQKVSCDLVKETSTASREQIQGRNYKGLHDFLLYNVGLLSVYHTHAC